VIPFISDTDLSAYLGTEVSETDLNVVIALDAACQVVRDELHRDVNYLGDDEVVLDGTGTDTFILPQRPVVEVTEILEDGDVVDPDDYQVDGPKGLVRLFDGCWLWGKGTLAVTYDHGWALSEEAIGADPRLSRVPSSIRAVALRLAGGLYRTTQVSVAVGGNVTEETIGSYNYKLDTATASTLAASSLTEDDRAMLRPWVDARVH